MRQLIDEGYDLARKAILEKSEEFERLAKGLLEYETLTGDEIRKVVAGEPLDTGDDASPPPAGNAPSLTAIPKTARPRAREGGRERRRTA